MYIVLGFKVIGMIWGAIKMWSEHKSVFVNIYRSVFGFFIGCFIGSIVGLIFALIVGVFVKDVHPEWIETSVVKTINIMNIQDNSTTSGTFFLGCGSINGIMYYSYYEVVGDNEFKLCKLDVDVANIRYISEGEKPRIEQISRELSRDSTNWGTWLGNPQYNIYVPNGSIHNNFNLDAQ